MIIISQEKEQEERAKEVLQEIIEKYKKYYGIIKLKKWK